MSFILPIMIIVVFVLINEQITDNRKCSFRLVCDTNAYAYQIESINIEKNDLVIKGWFFELKSVQNVPKVIEDGKKLGIVLNDLNKESEKDIDGNLKNYKGINLTVNETIRQDVNEYFKCEYNYSQCGFEARIEKEEIDLENGQYQVIIKPESEDDVGIGASAYLNHGKLMYVNPKDEISLNVSGTDLENIIKNGYCLVSCPEFFISVYQYKNKLYWIADTDYYFEADNGTYIQYHLDTTQFEKLPVNRTTNGYYWSNIGGDFEANEISSEMNCGRYRVSSRNIPEEYSVTQIETGYYVDGKWIWERCFRPIYDFGQ